MSNKIVFIIFMCFGWVCVFLKLKNNKVNSIQFNSIPIPIHNSHIHTFTHSHIHTFTHSHIHTFTHSHMHTCTHSHIHTFTHSHIHTCTHSHIHTLAHLHICTLPHFLTSSHFHIPSMCMLTCLACQDRKSLRLKIGTHF